MKNITRSFIALTLLLFLGSCRNVLEVTYFQESKDTAVVSKQKFIEDHLDEAQKGVYLYGSRVNILPDFVSDVFLKKNINFNLFSKEIKNKTRSLHLPFLSKIYKKHLGISRKFRGCNVSYWREDFIAINGYNEDFEGWGREDSDLAIRLLNNGIAGKRLKFCGILPDTKMVQLPCI